MPWWIWVLVAIFLLTLEFFATTLHSGFFAAGALLVAALVASGIGGPLWAQLLTFTAFSLATLFFIRPYVVRKLRLNETKVVDTMVGEQATALEDMPAAAYGRAEMRGSTWSAQNIGATNLTRGQRCTVERTEGLMLYVRA